MAVQWRKGGFKMSVAGTIFYAKSHILENSAKKVHFLQSCHSYFLEAQFCRCILMNVSKRKEAYVSIEDFGM